MTSIITNSSAALAMATLRQINGSLNTTNQQVSTGKTINSAADSAAYWNIGTTLNADNGALGAVRNAIDLSAAKADTASVGMNDATEIVQKIKSTLVSAMSATADRGALQTQISDLQKQLVGVVDSASYSGDNWLEADLSGGAVEKQIASSFSRTSNGVSVGTTDLTLNGSTVLIDTSNNGGGILDAAAKAGVSNSSVLTLDISNLGAYKNDATGLVGSNASDNDVLSALLAHVDGQLGKMVGAASTFGEVSTRLDSQSKYAQALIDINGSSAGALIDANMEEEATKLKALQTQQQLAVQSLSIANNSSSNIMNLFR